MNFQQKDRITAYASFRFMLIGNALNIIMPSGAGDIAKSYFGFVETGIKERMLSVSLYDKIIAIAAISVFALAAYSGTQKVVYLLVAIVSVMPLIVLHVQNYFCETGTFVYILNSIETLIKRISIRRVLREINFDFFTVAYTFFVSILSWVFTYILLQYCLQLVGMHVSLKETLFASSILTISRLFPFTLNGIGTDEAITIYLFSKTSADNEIVLMGALLYRLILIIVPAIPGLFFILTTRKKGE